MYQHRLSSKHLITFISERPEQFIMIQDVHVNASTFNAKFNNADLLHIRRVQFADSSLQRDSPART